MSEEHIRKTEPQGGGGQSMRGRQMIVTTAMPDERCCSWSRVRGAARARTRGPDSAIRTWCCEFAATRFSNTARRSALHRAAAKVESAGVKRTTALEEITW
jgi:hypothetical protein